MSDLPPPHVPAGHTSIAPSYVLGEMIKLLEQLRPEDRARVLCSGAMYFGIIPLPEVRKVTSAAP